MINNIGLPGLLLLGGGTTFWDPALYVGLLLVAVVPGPVPAQGALSALGQTFKLIEAE